MIHVLKYITIGLLLLCARMQSRAQIQLPANMYADTLHAPFLHGVASGDPLADRIMLWTKFTPSPGQSTPVSLTWEIASDNAFSQIVNSGTVLADPAKDWCAKVDVGGLQGDTRYWYRFRAPNGNYSMNGRTQTAPSPNQSNSEFRAAIASCSSVYSGFFNAYERIGQRNDLDLLIHLGDYIYDFVDADEEVRVPTPYPSGPVTLQDWRDRHAYYLLDPDLRLARARLPWSAIWDNHDLDDAVNPEPKQAFFEYLPIRQPDSNDIGRIYRKLSFGNLVDLFLIDVTTKRNVDTLPGGLYSIIGDDQWAWLSSELLASTAQWKMIGNERMVGEFSLSGLPAFIPFGDGPVADSSAWDGFTADRDRLLNFLTANNLHNTIFLSGDIHMSFACDLAPSSATYDPQTGAGSAAIEFLPTSISRGNFDEAGFGGFIATLAQAAMTAANPHHVFEELESHGYGILDIRPARAVGEYWYSDILQTTTTENFAAAFQCLDGTDHWDRNALTSPTVSVEENSWKEYTALNVSPNPNSGGQIRVEIPSGLENSGEFAWISAADGKLIASHSSENLQSGTLDLEMPALAAGLYFLRLKTAENVFFAKVIVIQE